MAEAAVFGLVCLGLCLMAGAQAAAQDAAGLYVEHCQACHQEGGVGSPGLAPPLVSPALETAAPDYIPLVMLSGLSGRLEAGGEAYPGAMPALDVLTDAEVAAIANMVRTTFNGVAGSRLKIDDIARLRAAAPADRKALLDLRKGAGK